MGGGEGKMGDVVSFGLKKQKPSIKHKGKTLCKSGFHKWQIETSNTFDVKSGKLVTSYRCKRCNAVKNSAR